MRWHQTTAPHALQALQQLLAGHAVAWQDVSHQRLATPQTMRADAGRKGQQAHWRVLWQGPYCLRCTADAAVTHSSWTLGAGAEADRQATPWPVQGSSHRRAACLHTMRVSCRAGRCGIPAAPAQLHCGRPPEVR